MTYREFHMYSLTTNIKKQCESDLQSSSLQACFNIVYLGYIICENVFFYSKFGNILIIVNLNQSQ